MIRVLVNGAGGRMGTLACEAIRTSGDCELVGTCGRGDDLAAAIGKARAEVVVDLTLPAAVTRNALAIVDAGARPVIGTSGFDAAGREELARRCESRKLGGIVAPNFAIGALLMMRFAALAARHLAAVEILEAHHPGKKDAPSGTALATAAAIRAARGGAGAEIPIHSTRLPGIVAEQSVVFGDLGQKLVIEHVAYGRDAYMPGLLLACRRVPALDRLVVGLDQILFETAR